MKLCGGLWMILSKDLKSSEFFRRDFILSSKSGLDSGRRFVFDMEKRGGLRF